jgi:hypothetical protein
MNGYPVMKKWLRMMRGGSIMALIYGHERRRKDCVAGEEKIYISEDNLP